jgi:predicted ATPase with chaperone activity
MDRRGNGRVTVAERADFVPRAPERLEDLGLSSEFVIELLLRTLYVQGARSGQELSDAVRIPFILLDDLLLSLQQRRLAEVLGTNGVGRGAYIFDLTDTGRGRAREAMMTARYVGPAPVPLAQYSDSVRAQSISHAQVDAQTVKDGFGWLVLDDATLDLLGPAINSAKSIFLYGESGNGKSAIAETISRLLGGSLMIPYAVEVHGEILGLFDPIYHSVISENMTEGSETFWIGSEDDYDRRYVRIKRPVVLTGGELTLDQLELQYDMETKLYQAPFQMKANGGVLIVDDFGRQRVPPRDLLNRWIVPLEKREDYLALHTGSKFPIPFDCLLIFATNIPPTQLVEEAFLRRIHYKVRVESPTVEQYQLIFRRYCEEAEIAYDPQAVGQVYRDYYGPYKIAPRGCHPRDLLEHLRDIASYLQMPPVLSPALVDRACRSYFLDFPTALRQDGSSNGGVE